MAGLEATTINPRVIFYSATEPDDKTEGKLWYNTTNATLYVSNGTSYIQIGVDSNFINDQQIQQNFNILINSVAATSTLNDYDDMYLDIFTDADGVEDTIDTVNTNADYDAENDNYFNGTETPTSPIASETITNPTTAEGGQTAEKLGWVVTPVRDLELKSITKSSSCTAVNVVVRKVSDSSIIATSANFSGQTATFSDEVLLRGVAYNVFAWGGGASFAPSYNAGTSSFPFVNADISIEASGNPEDWNRNFTTMTTEGGDIHIETRKVQTNAQTITADPLGHQLYCHNILAGTGNITYDISFDDGSTWITDQALNTKNASVHTGTEMIIRIQLNGNGEGNTSKIEDYGVMLFY